MQEISKNFVCVAEECFFLFPPEWVTNPPNPKSTELFKTYVKNAPPIWDQDTTTHQGIYTMTADGEYLSGVFASPDVNRVRAMMRIGLGAFEEKKAATESKPIPTNSLALVGGKQNTAPGEVKLQVSYRDLPRGELRRPGSARFPNPYNQGWFDLTRSEAQQFAAEGQVDKRLLTRLSIHLLKDAVRGQTSRWKPENFLSGNLKVNKVRTDNYLHYYQYSGKVELKDSNRNYHPELYGIGVYHSTEKRFLDFQLIATGQREGKSGANGRTTDLGPAPMAVAIRMHR